MGGGKGQDAPANASHNRPAEGGVHDVFQDITEEYVKKAGVEQCQAQMSCDRLGTAQILGIIHFFSYFSLV